MSTVANLLVRLGADFGDAPGKIEDLREGFEQAGEAADDAGDKVDKAGKHAEEAGGEFEGLDEKIGELGKELLKMGGEALEIAGVFEVLKESLEVSAEIESISVAFDQLTGSAEAATEMIEQLEVIAGQESLKFPEVLPAAQHFMALGYSAEQTEKTIKVAGDASWVLGTSLESVTQRMGMMASAGMVSGRYLRTLGINVEDLARAMGITGKDAADMEDKVREAFKFETEEERMSALQGAMSKFAPLAEKEAETLTGRWIEMRNSMHEMFQALGDDLAPLAETVIGAVTTITGALTDLFTRMNIIKEIKLNVEPPKFGGYIDDQGHKVKPLTRDELEKKAQSGAEPLAVPGTGGILAPDVMAGIKERSQMNLPQATLEAAAAAKKALEEAEASQNYARRKTEIDSESAHYKSLLEVQREYYQSQVEAKSMTQEQLTTLEKGYNFAELQDTLDAIAKKKSLQANTKGLKEEDKDATLDAQAEKARDEYAARNAALDDKLVVSRVRTVDELVKLGEKLSAKQEAEQDKMLKDLQDFEADTAEIWRKYFEEQRKVADAQAAIDEKSAGTSAHGTAQSSAQSVKQQQMELERAHATAITQSAAEQVAYERQLGDLAARQLDIKAREAAEIAKASMARHDELQQSAEVEGTPEAKDRAQQALNKANDDALKVIEAQAAAEDARYETQTKILEIMRQQSVEAQLAAQLESAGRSIPGALGGAIAAGLTHQGRGGEDIGKQVADAMRNVGRQLFGDVLTAAMKQMIESLGLNTLAQNIMHVLFGANTTATIANTAATAANTVASGGLLGKLLSHLGIHTHAAKPAGSTSSGQGSPGSDPNLRYQLDKDIETDLVQLDTDIQHLDTTDSGLDNSIQQISQAIQRLIAQMQQCGCGENKSSHGGSGGLIAGIGTAAAAIGLAAVSIFGGGGNAGGEAAGGIASADVTHLVGENGPELFTPRSTGTIIPNSALGGGSSINGDVHIHVNGAQDPRETARAVADELKNMSPSFAAQSVPYST